VGWSRACSATSSPQVASSTSSKIAGRWGLVLRQSIYEKDRIPNCSRTIQGVGFHSWYEISLTIGYDAAKELLGEDNVKFTFVLLRGGKLPPSMPIRVRRPLPRKHGARGPARLRGDLG
jgi:hypothetical protein